MTENLCARSKINPARTLFLFVGVALLTVGFHSAIAHAAVEISDGSVKALYHFDNDLTDGSGNGTTLNNASTSFGTSCASRLSKEVQFGSSPSFVSAPTSSNSYFSLPDPTASGTIGFWWDIGATGFQILAGLDTGGGSNTKWNVYYSSGLMHLEGYNSGLTHFDLNFSYTPKWRLGMAGFQEVEYAWRSFSGSATGTDFAVSVGFSLTEISNGSVHALYHFENNASDTTASAYHGTYQLSIVCKREVWPRHTVQWLFAIHHIATRCHRIWQRLQFCRLVYERVG